MGSQLSPEEVAKRYGDEAKWFKDEQPPHPVEITKPFYLQITEVSQGQWKKVMGNNPSSTLIPFWLFPYLRSKI